MASSSPLYFTMTASSAAMVARERSHRVEIQRRRSIRDFAGAEVEVKPVERPVST
jgi:hypothetical protein